MKYRIKLTVSGERDPYTTNEIEASKPEEAVKIFFDELEETCGREKNLAFIERNRHSITYYSSEKRAVVKEIVIAVTESI